MTKDELRALLLEAGRKFDGHVTNGSIEAQVAAVWPLLLNPKEYMAKIEEILNDPKEPS